MARERTPYFKRYPKIVRAKRIILPIAIGVMLVCLVTAINNPGSFWWLGVMLGTIGMLWAGSPTARPLNGPQDSDDELNRYLRYSPAATLNRNPPYVTQAPRSSASS